MPLSEREELELLELEEKELGQSKVAAPAPNVSKTESALRGAAQGATGSFGDELSGALDYGLGKLTDKFRGEPLYPESYGEMRDSYRKENREARDAHPVIYGASEVAGSLPATIALGGSGLSAAKQGLITGAITGAGASEADSALGVAEDTALGAGTGAFFGKVADKFQGAAKDTALSSGRRALGFNKGLLKKAGGIDKAERAVGTLLDEGGVIAPWRSVSGMDKKLDVLQEVTGKKIGSVLKQIDDSGIKLVQPAMLIDDLAKTEIPGLGKTIAEVAEDVPEVAKVFQEISDILKKRAGESGDLATSFNEANYIKKLLGKTIDWTERDAAGNVGNMTKKLMYHAINDSVDNSLSQAAKQIGDKALGQEFSKAKDLYGAVSTAQKGVKDRVNREAGNKAIGLTDWLLGSGAVAATLSHGNPLLAVPLVAGKKLGEKYGAQALSSVANVASKIPVSKAAGVIGGAGAMTVNEMGPGEKIRDGVKQNGANQDIPIERMGKFSATLMKAKQKSPQALAATNYVLSQSNPEYRELLKQGEDQWHTQ